MRLDKFLKVSRILKRRTVAAEACDLGRVYVDGKQRKPSYKLSVGDIVVVYFAKGELKFRVLSIDSPHGAKECEAMYEVLI